MIDAERYIELSIDNDFMDVGGHSLLKIKVDWHISKEIGHAIMLGLLICNPIFSNLDKAIDQFIANC